MNKKGFTLVELLAVIAILVILILLSIPNILDLFNNSKKDTFITEARNYYKEAKSQYIIESEDKSVSKEGIKFLPNPNNNSNDKKEFKLDISGKNLNYRIVIDSNGKITAFCVDNGIYVIKLISKSSGYTKQDIKLEKAQLIGDGVTGCDDFSTAPAPVAFATDSWETISNAVKTGNTEVYNVGDTRQITIASHENNCLSYSSYNSKFKCWSATIPEQTVTLRIANKSTPSECSNDDFSQTGCGFVIEFVDIIDRHLFNYAGVKGDATSYEYQYGTSYGGYKDSELRRYINETIYNILPNDLKNVITKTKAISGYGNPDDSENFVTNDELFLLAPHEIWADDTLYDTAYNQTRQLDYYKNNNTTTSNFSAALKNYENKGYVWYLRSAYNYLDRNYIYMVYHTGKKFSFPAYSTYGIAPAFKVG